MRVKDVVLVAVDSPAQLKECQGPLKKFEVNGDMEIVSPMVFGMQVPVSDAGFF